MEKTCIMNPFSPLTAFKPASNSMSSHNAHYDHNDNSKKPINLFYKCLEPNVPADIVNTVTNTKCFLHYEGYKTTRSVDINYLPVSKSFPAECKTIIEMLDSCEIDSIDSKWISLPAYDNKSKPGRIKDFQCATTGTKSSLDADYFETSARECAEENGIKVTDEDLIGYKTFDFNGKHVEAFVYYVTSIQKPGNFNLIPKNTENYKHKIMSFILFDNPDDIVNRVRVSSKLTADAAGEVTVVMKVKDLKNIIKLCF